MDENKLFREWIITVRIQKSQDSCLLSIKAGQKPLELPAV